MKSILPKCNLSLSLKKKKKKSHYSIILLVIKLLYLKS